MKTLQKFYLVLGLIALMFSSCKKDVNDDDPVISSLKKITSFKVGATSGDIDNTNKTISVVIPADSDLTSVSPTIALSPKSTVSPASGVVQNFTNNITYTVTAEDGSTAEYDVHVELKACNFDNVFAFTYGGKNYEIIKANETWEYAKTCAIERGGYLAEITSAEENNAIFFQLISSAGIELTNTVSTDGGNASYVWLGGNDLNEEGEWYWDHAGNQFWQGDYNGASVGGSYTNWGDEPDNYANQDCLGIALTQWPIGSGSLGSAEQWNDLDAGNELYYVIEFD